MVIARLSSVSKAFDGLQALANLDLTVEEGEVFGLLGPNGAGKTTAVRILCGLLAPDSGTAEIGGLDVAADPVGARRLLGFVPDGAPLYANLSARQHLTLVGRLHGFSEAKLGSEVARLLDAFGLSGREDDAVGSFSHGMRQKTALACALLPAPRLLVLDEPLTGLDAPTTSTVKELLRTFADRGGAVLYTSHMLDIVERVCDRMAVVEKGRLVAQGDMAALREQSGEGGSLERVFARITKSEDPSEAARKILGYPRA
jgi:ABC-2 type transport system ATP-binding protein